MLTADMDLSDVEHAVEDFCKSVLNPILAAKNSESNSGGSLPMEAWQACADFGLLAANIDPEKGGLGLRLAAAVQAMISLGRYCLSSGFTFAVNTTLFSHAPTLQHCVSQDQCERYLQPLIQGRKKAAYALSELNSGSDAFALETYAQATDDGYLLTGCKSYVSLGPVADFAIVFAQTDSNKARWGISAFIVELDNNGISTEPVSKAGLHDTPMGEIRLDNCFVPKANLLHSEGAGVAIFEESQLSERSFIWASQVGAMQRQLSSVIDYSRKRKQSGQVISSYQSVSNRLADMKVRACSAELMLQNTARLKEQGQSIRVESAMTKLLLSESYLENSLDAVRIMGAKGYTGKAQAISDLNDAIAGLLLGGTNDVQRNLISKLMGS